MSPWIRRCMRTGQGCLGLAMLGLIIGGTIVTAFFPQLKKQNQLPPFAWYILVPIWSLGGFGILLMIMAWLFSTQQDDELEGSDDEEEAAQEMKLRSDGRYLSPFTRYLGGLLLALLMLSGLNLLGNDVKITISVPKEIIFYIVETLCGFLLYLCIWYTVRHRVINYYLNTFSMFFGILLIPVTLPFLLIKVLMAKKPRPVEQYLYETDELIDNSR